MITPKINISDKNLTNTEAQTIQKTLNDEEINFEDEENINDEVSEETIAKLTEIADTAPKLELVVKESFYLQDNLIIKINALGLVEKSLRDKKDGFTFFGLIPKDDEKNSKNIDFLTWNKNISDDKNNPPQYGRQFRIRFDLDEFCYFIKDCSCGSGYGSFMKIKEMVIKDNTLINIGNNYVVFTLGVDILESDENYQNSYNNNDERILSVKVFGGQSNNYSYAFNQSQISKILIGNDENCNIVLSDILSDEIHCFIEYKNDIGWVLNDGYNNKNSENGTWVCLSEETKIFEGMIIQSNQSIYECHIIK